MVNQNPVDRSRQRDSPRIAAYQAVVEIHQPSHPNPPGSPEPREPAPESCPQCPSLRRVFRDPFSRRTLWTTFLQEKIRSSTSYHSPTSYGKNIILSLDQQTAIATSSSSTAGRKARIQTRALPAVGCSVLLALLFVLDGAFSLKRLGIYLFAVFSDAYCDITIVIDALHVQFFEMLSPECDA